MSSAAFGNQELEDHLDQETTAENMGKIQHLKYTLANVLQSMDQYLKSIVGGLEGMRLVSVATTEFS